MHPETCKTNLCLFTPTKLLIIKYLSSKIYIDILSKEFKSVQPREEVNTTEIEICASHVLFNKTHGLIVEEAHKNL